MKSCEYEAVTLECGGIYCVDCVPDGIQETEVFPIFADSEWDYVPVCDECGERHDYISLTKEGIEYEREYGFEY